MVTLSLDQVVLGIEIRDNLPRILLGEDQILVLIVDFLQRLVEFFTSLDGLHNQIFILENFSNQF